MDRLELLAHPVRLRVVHAMSAGRALTTSELCERMPDVSKATVYRHVGLLADAGVLEVEGEQRVRGAVERRYRLRQDVVAVGANEVATLSAEDHRRVFAAAMATLIAEFNAYLDRTEVVADTVGYRQHAVWLSPEELGEVVEGMRAAIVPMMANEPAPGRTRYLLSPVMFPVEEPEEGTGGTE
ncbi:helix-turn-helix domain-containing protein [Phytomonospora endophytica]|uniref:DNA-binding transcriptional ArsR family regulator n=1 Tax=Phytomonospora endophytica TaxID=714109 RepID=A0A841FHK8_9ACTN|nr:helix-turn-helix domain-containing protein [Phytomonospora endophytica]MBB6035354.1 DNA-binding transcriptional ArsR family regulator [Phytomonospora endophytica]GIG63894.1 transcriptional regulator [Phytomonospora endophytica]